jgi:hypothetical protein
VNHRRAQRERPDVFADLDDIHAHSRRACGDLRVAVDDPSASGRR